MKTKTITTSVLLSLLMITLAACSSTTTEDLTSKKDQEIATRKAEVEALAKEYGVNVFINEEVWAQRVPSYEEVEVYFESIKSRKSGLAVSETTSSTDATIAKASTSLEYTPTRLARHIEFATPITGTLNFYNKYVSDEIKIPNSHVWMDLTLDWRIGGYTMPDKMVLSASNISDTDFDGDFSIDMIHSQHYLTSGSGPSFSAFFILKYERNRFTTDQDELLRYDIWINISYNYVTGIGFCDEPLVDAESIKTY